MPVFNPVLNNQIIASAIPVIIPPSAFFANNGVIVIGQAPSNSATVSFSATSGSGVTMTFSAATLLGTAADVGRVLTILDTTYKLATITAQSSTTVATVTLTGTLSGTGPFANNSIWLSGTAYGTANTVAFSSPFQSTYPNCYLVLPAAAIAASGAGSAAGVYYAQMASATQGTVFNNTLASGAPTIPASPTAFATTGPGAFSQTTGSDLTALTLAIAANLMGKNGRIEIGINQSNNNSANNKILKSSFGGTAYLSNTGTTNQNTSVRRSIMNKGVTNAQISQALAQLGAGAVAGQPTLSSVDTTASQNIVITGQLANANDSMQIDEFWILGYPG